MRCWVASLGALMVAIGTPGPAPGEVRLRSRTLAAADGLDAAAMAALPAHADLFVVAARGRIDAGFHSELARSGIEPLTYLPDHAFAVWADPAALGRLLASGHAGFVVPIAATDRLAPELAHGLDDRPLLVEALVVPRIGHREVASAFARLGVEVLGQGRGRRFDRVVVRLTPGLLRIVPELAGIPGVFSIARRPVYRLRNDSSISTHQVGINYERPQFKPLLYPIHDAGIRGEGQVIASLDTGLDLDSCQFRDPAGLPPLNLPGESRVDLARRKVIAYDFLYSGDNPADPAAFDNEGHGTHVLGSAAGDDLTRPGLRDAGDGAAPAAQVVVQDGGFAGGDACSDLPALGCPVVDITPYLEQAHEQGARIHLDPWGDQGDTDPRNQYTTASVDVDDFVRGHPDFLMIFPKGDGQRLTMTSPATAKNVVTVAATRHDIYAYAVSPAGATGRAADGRLKPLVTCVGENVRSASGDRDISTSNCATEERSGTSMATGMCGGLAALVRQYFTEGYYPSGRPRPADGFAPSAALLRAALMSSARSMHPGLEFPGPTQGFGRVTLADVLLLRTDPRWLFVADEADTFATGSTATWSHTVEVIDPAQPLKVSLAWTDVSSNPLAATNLVNDLDLVVRGPSATWLGNVFSAGASTTGGNPDRLNVEEEVLLPAPAAGTYVIEVRAANVPQGPQGFGLVATGGFAGPAGVLAAGIRVTDDAVNPACSDGDLGLDAWERVRIAVEARNASAVPATAVVASLATTSPWVRVRPPTTASIGMVAAFSSATAEFEVQVLDALCGSEATFEVEVMSAENSAPDPGAFTLPLEIDRAPALRTLAFENGLVDSAGMVWTATPDFVLSTARVNSGTSSLWAGMPPGPGHCDLSYSEDGANACGQLLSPPIVPSSGSTLRLATWYQLQPLYFGNYLDRASVHLIEPDWTHILLVPSGGRGYQSNGSFSVAICHIGQEDSWTGEGGMSWATSDFDLAPWAGIPVRIEVNYNTNIHEICEGIYLDDIELAGVYQDACDALTCAPVCDAATLPPIERLLGARSGPSAIDWTWSVPGTEAREIHLNSVLLAADLGDADPSSPRLPPSGRGVLECRETTAPGCADPDALPGRAALVLYQALAACGPLGLDEGPP